MFGFCEDRWKPHGIMRVPLETAKCIQMHLKDAEIGVLVAAMNFEIHCYVILRYLRRVSPGNLNALISNSILANLERVAAGAG
ncbi:MAG: hypothetical protein SFY80_11000 [Verrucomicrobiota bacterium]|nr:hypothetical protein [Verrucomicrobiota bacterium]